MITDRIIYELAVQYSQATTHGERTRIGRQIDVAREGMFNNTRKILDSISYNGEARVKEAEADIYRMFGIQKGDRINAFIHFYQKNFDCQYISAYVENNRNGILIILDDSQLSGKYKKSHFIPLYLLDGVKKISHD